ncbi:uncharacterized protein [Mobula birostris]|uniref:uncharacterized protein isoform X2 n=1 Tax=Mobula birostris TaxID=1983395 RepID=UPI003B27D569
MNPEIWDSDGGSTSESSDLPNIVSSDEELKPWFPPFKPAQLSYEVLIPKRWCYLRTSVLKRYCHIVKVQLLSPILFGRPYTDELYRNWAVQADLIQHEDYGELQDLDLKTLKIIDLLESAHRALLVYAMKRPLLIQFVRVVNENLVQCSTLEEATNVVKQQTIFRDAWKMTVGNKTQVAAVLALTGLHYFNLIKQYSIDQNDLFEQFEDQCLQEEQGHYLFAGALCGKGWYTRALKANSLAIQACQRKRMNVKGLTEQRELIQTEQVLSSKEKEIGNQKSDNTSLKESSGSESSPVEEDDEEDDESREDEAKVVDVWLEVTKDNDVQAEQEQNDQSLHFDIPFLSLNFKASSSDSEHDSFDGLNQGHGSKVLPSGHTSDSESGSSLKEDQRDFTVPHNSVGSDSQEKDFPAIGTEAPPDPFTDSGKDVSAPGTIASSSSTGSSKDLNSLSVSSGAHQSPYQSVMAKEIEQVCSDSKQRVSYNNAEQEEEQKSEMSSKVEESLLRCKLKEASEALMASNFRNAQENYLHALKLIKEKKVYNLTTMEYILVEYACGFAFLGNNLIQDVLEAERHFKKILEEFRDEDRSNFSCLSYYGLSRVHLKWNRYKEARSFIEKSLKLVESNLVPGLQTWPGTDTTIEETRDGALKDLLNALLKECLCPPRPDAVCHYRFCCTHNSKQDIYRSDPDFKGFVRVHCSYDCRIEYHLYCWKRCKIKEFQDKIEKDILGLDCLTPDCMGCIWKVDIFQDSRQKTIESSKSREHKSARNTATKQCSSTFNLKKIARKKEKKQQIPVKHSSSIYQDQIDTPNKKTDQTELKDDPSGARRRDGKYKKNNWPSDGWIKDDKIGYTEEATAKVYESSFVDSGKADYYYWSTKEEKLQNSFARMCVDEVLLNQHPSLDSTKSCDAAVLTDPIRPFESKQKTFLILYHDKAQLLKSYEKLKNVYNQLCSDTQDELRACKEKHEQLLLNEKKLRDELSTVKTRLGSVREKLHDQREFQSQELGAVQEELKSVKNDAERNKKTIHEIDGEIKKIKGKREKQTSDKKKLQKMRGNTKAKSKESATRLLSVQSQIQEWKKYTKLYFLNRQHQEAVDNVKFFSTLKTRNANSPEVIASHDMWERQMKGIQGQINLIQAASSPQESEYSDGVPNTDSSELIAPQFRGVNDFKIRQGSSPSPTRAEMRKNVGFAGASASAEAGWFSPGSRTRGINAKTLPRTAKDAYIPLAWPPNYTNPPAMQHIPLTDCGWSDSELEFRVPTDQNQFHDESLQLAAGGLEMTNPSAEANPDISLSGLQTSHVSGNLQSNPFETYSTQINPFNKHFNHLPPAQPIIQSGNNLQVLRAPGPLVGACANSAQTDEPQSSYHTVMKQLFFKFPTISKTSLHSLINKVKDENGGTLSNLSVDELVRQVSYHVHQGTHPDTVYASSTDTLSFAPMSYENPFYPGHHTLHSDQSAMAPNGFCGLAPVGADESLPLGDLLEMEGCFDHL